MARDRLKRVRGAPNTPSSPMATGDAGGRYQDRVGGYVLAALLTRQPLPDMSSPLVEVGFQRSIHGATLDDLVVRLADDSKIELTIKSALKVQKSNADLQDTLRRAWSSFRSSGDTLFGLVAPPTAGIMSFRRLLFLAKTNESTSDFVNALAAGRLSSEHRRHIAAIREVLDSA